MQILACMHQRMLAYTGRPNGHRMQANDHAHRLVPAATTWKTGYCLCIMHHLAGDYQNEWPRSHVTELSPLLTSSLENTSCMATTSLLHYNTIYNTWAWANTVVGDLSNQTFNSCLSWETTQPITVLIVDILLNYYIWHTTWKYFKALLNCLNNEDHATLCCKSISH